MWFLGTATVKKLHQKFCKGNIFFPKNCLESSILQSSVSFYLKRGVLAGYSFFQTYWLLLKDQLEPPISSCRVIYFTEQLQSFIFSGVIMKQINFDSSYKNNYRKSYFSHSIILRVVYLFHHFNNNHPSFEVGHLFLSQKEKQSWKKIIIEAAIFSE